MRGLALLGLAAARRRAAPRSLPGHGRSRGDIRAEFRHYLRRGASMKCEACQLATRIWHIRPGPYCDVCAALNDPDRLRAKLAQKKPRRWRIIALLHRARDEYLLACAMFLESRDEAPSEELVDSLARLQVTTYVHRRVFQRYALTLRGKDIGQTEAEHASAVLTVLTGRVSFDLEGLPWERPDLAEPRLGDGESLLALSKGRLLRPKQVRRSIKKDAAAKVPFRLADLRLGRGREVSEESLGDLRPYARGTLAVTDQRLIFYSGEHLDLKHAELTGSASDSDEFAVYHRGPPATAYAFRVCGTAALIEFMCATAHRRAVAGQAQRASTAKGGSERSPSDGPS